MRKGLREVAAFVEDWYASSGLTVAETVLVDEREACSFEQVGHCEGYRDEGKLFPKQYPDETVWI